MRALRWWVLLFASLANLAAYYAYDAIAPVTDMLHRQLGLSYAQIGTLNAVYSIPPVFLTLVGGVLVDRLGAARMAVWTAAVYFAGALITAAGSHYPLMLLGRFLLGVGGETLFVALIAAVGQWFTGRSTALAMALFFSLTRIGSWLADISPVIARGLYEHGWRPPLLLAAAVTGLGLAAACAYRAIEARSPALPSMPAATAADTRIASLKGVHPAFWSVLAMATVFYSVIYPFRSTFSIDYFQNARGLSLQQAGLANSWVFFAAIFASPVFGWLSDRHGHRNALMTLGTLTLTLSFVILGATGWNLWVTTALVGLSYSLVPAIVWPAVAELVDARRLGIAYGLMTVLQDAGIAAVNVIVGWLNDRGHAGAGHPEGYAAMIWFLGSLSLAGTLLIGALWFRQWRAAPTAGRPAP